MKLYELLFRHYSPKDSEEGIICYLVANSDKEVYEFIKSEPIIPDGTEWGRSIYNSWKYKDDEEDSSYDENHKQRLIKCGGEMFDITQTFLIYIMVLLIMVGNVFVKTLGVLKLKYYKELVLW